MVSAIVYFHSPTFVSFKMLESNCCFCPTLLVQIMCDCEIVLHMLCTSHTFCILGGIARFKVYGEITWHPHDWDNAEYKDVFSMQNGCKCLTFSNAHYGHPRNLTKPGTAANMGDGWETHVNIYIYNIFWQFNNSFIMCWCYFSVVWIDQW